MAAPILAGIGKMFTGVVAGTARGIAMGARATATTAKSGGRLVQSASNVKSNIVKSNKKIRKIKLNRRRINKSIFNEQKRRAREKQFGMPRTESDACDSFRTRRAAPRMSALCKIHLSTPCSVRN